MNLESSLDSQIYSALNKVNLEIRLLEIIPSSGQTTCHLHTVSLNDNPQFTALSYVWGDPTVRETIVLNNQAFSVAANLASALRHVQKHWAGFTACDASSLRLWADAISINQADNAERSNQVQFMGSIYSSAELVISWLGPLDSSICLGLETASLVSSELEKLGSEPDMSLDWMRKHPSLCEVAVESNDGLPIGNKWWDGVLQVLSAPYWGRVWICQEVLLANSLLLACGEIAMSWRAFLKVVSWREELAQAVIESQFPRPDFLALNVWAFLTSDIFNEWDNLNKIIATIDLLSIPGDDDDDDNAWSISLWGMSLAATDPKDHVYGLLGLTNINLEPDYTHHKKAGDVYCDYVISWFADGRRKDGSPEALFFLPMSGVALMDAEEMPSWAPNFASVSKRFYSETEGLAVLTRLDGQADSSVFEHDIDNAKVVGESLVVSGVEIARVAHVYDKWDVDEGLSSVSDQVIDYISRHPTYPTGIHPLKAFLRALLRDRDNGDLSMEGTAFLSLMTKELEKTCSISDILRRFGILGSSDEELNKSFSGAFTDGEGHDEDLIAHLRSNDVDFEAYSVVYSAFASSANSHCFIETDQGYLGLAPTISVEGDKVCILKGCNVPVVLRRDRDCHSHIGTCLVLGFMDGEAAAMVQAGKLEFQQFKIK